MKTTQLDLILNKKLIEHAFYLLLITTICYDLTEMHHVKAHQHHGGY